MPAVATMVQDEITYACESVVTTRADYDVMAEPSALEVAWLSGGDGLLCAREQAKAWALREAWNEEGKSTYGLLTYGKEPSHAGHQSLAARRKKCARVAPLIASVPFDRGGSDSREEPARDHEELGC